MCPIVTRRQFPHPTLPSFSPHPAPTLPQFLTPAPHLHHHTVRVCPLTSMSIAGRANWRVLLILIILILYCCHL